ncbi:MAG: PLP-dependent transferase, partial [Holophagales bacterium]|nr:PLP-dependent transferase [Holophagales bacterium]
MPTGDDPSTPDSSRLDLTTRLVHAAGCERERGAAVPAVHRATVWELDGEGMSSAEGEYPSLRYPRYNDSPGLEGLGAQLADLENGEAGVVASSGMAAIAAALLSHLETGDHLLVSKDLYGGTHGIVTRRFPSLGIEHDLIDARDPDTWRELLRPS